MPLRLLAAVRPGGDCSYQSFTLALSCWKDAPVIYYPGSCTSTFRPSWQLHSDFDLHNLETKPFSVPSGGEISSLTFGLVTDRSLVHTG